MIVLETARLLFRDHEPGDLDPFCAMEADPEVRRYVGGRPRTREEGEQKFRDVYLKPITNRMGMWATVFKPEGRYIGYCGVYAGSMPGEGTLGYYIAHDYWGRGLASEAARAFVDFAFRDLALTRIIASVEAGNQASKRILEKLGFQLEWREPGERRSFDHFALERTP